ncbi:hypothetical protein ACP7H9_12955 [Idiomarina sp. ST20R2A10]|uniref:hypothetical protein n=1 Tax=Idiomarina sp. ST20R2A10 TaxID=3418369 RepID=UPI003EC805A7
MSEESTLSKYPASVVKVIDDYTVVINRGSEDGVSKGDQFLVYYVDQEELIDPETGESLGNLEVVRGTGSVTHVQRKMATIKSNRSVSRGRVIRRTSNPGIGGLLVSFAAERETIEEPEREALAFEDVQVKDRVKPV